MDLDLLREYQTLPDSHKRQRILDKLVRDNMPLVDKLARKYSMYSTVHFETEDITQAACIGLIRGIRGFDFNRGTRFSTYAALWIRLEIQMHLQQCTPIHRRLHKIGMPYKVLRKLEALTAKEGRLPTAEELGVTEVQWERWNALIFHFVPMDEITGEDRDDHSIGRKREYAHEEATAEEQLIAHERLLKAAKAIQSLTEIERRVLIDQDTKGLPQGVIEHTKATAIARLRGMFADP